MQRFHFLLTAFLVATTLQAQDYGLYWKYKDFDGSIALGIPRWATFAGSAFIEEKEDRQIVRKIRKVRVLFFEEDSPFSNRDIRKFHQKAKRRNLDELVTVRSGKTHVSVLVKEKRAIIRKVVVLFKSDEGSGLITVKGKFNLNEISKVIQKSGKDSKKDKELKLPKLPNVPVLKT